MVILNRFRLELYYDKNIREVIKMTKIKKEDLKLFTGGYYDLSIYDDDDYFDGGTPFDVDIETFTLNEVWELGFVSGLKDMIYKEQDKYYYELSVEEQIKAILQYTEGDEIAGLVYFETEEEAEDYKLKILDEIAERELQIEYKGKKQDNEGHYRDVYIKNDDEVLSFEEVTRIWNLNNSTLEGAITEGKFNEDEYRKTSKSYIFKKSAIEREYGSFELF
jgi:hypothetical protein